MSASLVVNRNSQDDTQLRQIYIELDGAQIAEMMFGDSLTESIAPGRHTLLANNTWNSRSLEFEIAENQEIHFAVKSTAGRFSWFLLMIFGGGPMYVSLERTKTP